jgi:protocatechuate 3,4-dioxygenase beta subunit
MTLLATPSQTVGPFFHIGCTKLFVSDLAGPDVPGIHITIEGRILDGERNPMASERGRKIRSSRRYAGQANRSRI